MNKEHYEYFEPKTQERVKLVWKNNIKNSEPKKVADNYNVNYKEIVQKFDIEDLKLRDKIIIVNNEHIFEYSDKRIAKAVFEKLKNFLFIVSIEHPYKTL